MSKDIRSKKEFARTIMKALMSKDQKMIEKYAKQELVMLLYGNNMFGKPVYSYNKFTVDSFSQMRKAMVQGQNIKPTDFSEVISAGKGEPSKEEQKEMEMTYGLVHTPRKPDIKKNENSSMFEFENDNHDSFEGLKKDISFQVKELGRLIKIQKE